MGKYVQELRWIISPTKDDAYLVGYGSLGNTLHYIVKREGNIYRVVNRTRNRLKNPKFRLNRSEFEDWCGSLRIEPPDEF